jgi:hypothetical protein
MVLGMEKEERALPTCRITSAKDQFPFFGVLVLCAQVLQDTLLSMKRSHITSWWFHQQHCIRGFLCWNINRLLCVRKWVGSLLRYKIVYPFRYRDFGKVQMYARKGDFFGEFSACSWKNMQPSVDNSTIFRNESMLRDHARSQSVPLGNRDT